MSLTFTNGKFKIIQIADAQELPAVSPDTVKLIEMALQAEKPDLVIFTGDQIYGIHPKLWGKAPAERVRRVFARLLAPVTAAGVPFAVTYGNHDAECGLPNTALAELFAAFPGYLPGERRAVDDPGTFRLPVYGADGTLKACVYAFDTHGGAAGKAGVTDGQLDWFRAQRATDGGTPALAFQHIPVPEYYNVIKKVPKGTPGAVEAYGARRGSFYALPGTLLAAGGFMKESPSVAGTGEFEALKNDGHVLCLAAGHDHNNSFAAPFEGIDLIYTQGAGFHVYGPHLKRGVRVFTLDETAPGAYATYTRTWESLTDVLPKEFFLEYALSKTPSSVAQGKAWAKKAAPFAAAGAAGAFALLVSAARRTRCPQAPSRCCSETAKGSLTSRQSRGT